MESFYDLISGDYEDIIRRTAKDFPNALEEIESVLEDIRKYINEMDKRVFSRKENLLIAIRLTEAFRIYNWIKVCLACGSYQSAFRELRFMLDGVAQACYIDINHMDASLESKLEVYKALCDMGGFIGGNLFERIKGLKEKQQLKDIYGELSRYVHPSIEESRKRIESPPPEGVVQSLMMNNFDRDLLTFTIDKCRQVGKLLVSINAHFEKECLGRI